MGNEQSTMVEKELVNEESGEEDEGYGSMPPQKKEKQKRLRRRRNVGDMDLEKWEEEAGEESKDNFKVLKEAYGELKDSITKLEFEVDILKDEKMDKEEEHRLLRTELMKLLEKNKLLEEGRLGDKRALQKQEEIINNFLEQQSVLREEKT